MYADDLVMWSTEEYAATAQIRLQTAVNILSNWANEWCVKINRSKTFTTLFTLSTKVKPVKIMLNHTELQHIDSATYLGVTFDRRQTWKPYICNAETKARRKLALLRKIAGTQLGAAEAVLKNVSTPRLWINNMLIRNHCDSTTKQKKGYENHDTG